MIDGDLNMSTPVIGLDRDGTINEDIGLTQEGVPPYCIKPEQFKPIPGSLEAVKMIRDKGYDVVILTNQLILMWTVFSLNLEFFSDQKIFLVPH